MSGEPVLVDNTGRTWPRITKDNAAQHPYPSLRHCKERGPGTAPYCWYLQISGEPTWDQEYTSFNKMKKKWDGWTGGNERRAQARRESAQQQETDRQGHRGSYRDAAAASRAATNAASTALLPHEEAQASILESRAGAICLTVETRGLRNHPDLVNGASGPAPSNAPQLSSAAASSCAATGARRLTALRAHEDT